VKACDDLTAFAKAGRDSARPKAPPGIESAYAGTVVNRGDFAFGVGMMVTGAFVCLTFLLFDSPILLVTWLLGLPMILVGLIGMGDGLWGRLGTPEARASPVARRQAIPPETKREVWARDSGTCVLCGAITDLQFDHLIPVSEGGNSPANLRVMCGSCHRATAEQSDTSSTR